VRQASFPFAIDQDRDCLDTVSRKMAPFIFTCPNTDLKVQHWLEDDEGAPKSEYEGITCPACTSVHFINRKTGKLFGQNED
jgi:NAD-dependent dihydropyrimidine dehydrogenase PreA subunit